MQNPCSVFISRCALSRTQYTPPPTLAPRFPMTSMDAGLDRLRVSRFGTLSDVRPRLALTLVRADCVVLTLRGASPQGMPATPDLREKILQPILVFVG